MDQKKRLGLKGLLASRNKGGSSKEVPKTQPPTIPPLPLPPTNLSLQAMPNLKKMRPNHELEEGELAPWKDNKRQKVAKDPRDKRGASVNSRDEAEVCRPQRTWALRLEMKDARCFDMGRVKRPCQLFSISRTTASSSS